MLFFYCSFVSFLLSIIFFRTAINTYRKDKYYHFGEDLIFVFTWDQWLVRDEDRYQGPYFVGPILLFIGGCFCLFGGFNPGFRF